MKPMLDSLTLLCGVASPAQLALNRIALSCLRTFKYEESRLCSPKAGEEWPCLHRNDEGPVLQSGIPSALVKPGVI